MLVTLDRYHTETGFSLLNIGPSQILVGKSDISLESPIFTDLTSSVDQNTLKNMKEGDLRELFGHA